MIVSVPPLPMSAMHEVLTVADPQRSLAHEQDVDCRFFRLDIRTELVDVAHEARVALEKDVLAVGIERP